MERKQNPLNDYALEMAELNLQFSPIAQEVILILNDNIRDHYQDPISYECGRVKKLAIIKKEPSLHYVQFDQTSELFEDTQNLPWIVSMTVKSVSVAMCDGSLRNYIQADDQLLIDGTLYTISAVEPTNRFLDNLVNCIIYPERASQTDPLGVHSVSDTIVPGDSRTRHLSLVWGGAPVSYRLCAGESISAAYDFQSHIYLADTADDYYGATGIQLIDASGTESEWFNLTPPNNDI